MEEKKLEAIPGKRDIRMIGLDLDGTTLTTDKRLTAHTKEVLEACTRKGILVLPATGRVRTGIPDFIRDIEGIRYVVTSNGGSIIDLTNNEVVYEEGIPWERALEIFDILEKYNTYYDCYAMGNGWSEARFYDHLPDYNITSHIFELVRSSRTRIDDLRAFIMEHKPPVEKMSMFFATEEERQKAFDELSQIEDIAVTYSLSNNIEINSYKCNKGDALIGLGKLLDIPKECIMGCGDGINDLAMIEKVGLGVAMENADQRLKESADFVTRSNDEEGVAYAIELFCNLL